MKVVRDDAARWLPSRQRFALTKLIALVASQLVASRRRRPSPRHVMLVIDRDQSTVEAYGLSILFLALTTCYAAELLPRAWALLALPLAAVVVQLPIVIVGLLLRPYRDNVALQSAVLMTLMLTASAWMATRPSWVRAPAWLFLALFAANALAAALLFALRRRVEELERRCGA